jgi:hypothetical protein
LRGAAGKGGELGFQAVSVRARAWGRRAHLRKARAWPGRRGGGGEALRAWLGGRRGEASRSGAGRCQCAPVCLRFSPDFEIEVHQVMNRKVVDLTSLYNFHKGSRVFSQRILQEYRANFECRHVSMHRRYWQLTKFFTLFHSKFEMPIYMKVVSLNKMDNFHKGRF